MKQITIVMLLVSVVAVFAAPQETPRPAEQFADRLVHWLTLRKHEVTPEEKDALRTAHRLLVLASSEEYPRKYFWTMVSASEPKEIEWNEAKQMILRGQVISVMQTHALAVSLVGRDGVEYRTREPKIDDVLHLVKEVDPKMVFIDYGTE